MNNEDLQANDFSGCITRFFFKNKNKGIVDTIVANILFIYFYLFDPDETYLLNKILNASTTRFCFDSSLLAVA